MVERPATEAKGTQMDPEDKVSLLRQRLAAKAKQEPGFRFYVLYDRIYRKDVLWKAWLRVRGNDGAPGVDGVSIKQIEAQERGALNLVDELHEDQDLQAAAREARIHSESEREAQASGYPDGEGQGGPDGNLADPGTHL